MIFFLFPFGHNFLVTIFSTHQNREQTKTVSMNENHGLSASDVSSIVTDLRGTQGCNENPFAFSPDDAIIEIKTVTTEDACGHPDTVMEVKRVSQGVTLTTKMNLSSNEINHLPQLQKLNTVQVYHLLRSEMKVLAESIEAGLRVIRKIEETELSDLRSRLYNTSTEVWLSREDMDCPPSTEVCHIREDLEDQKQHLEDDMKMIEFEMKKEHQAFSFLKFLLKKLVFPGGNEP